MASSHRASGLLRVVLACALVSLGLALAVRRQSRGLELVRAVERARAERAVAEAERAELVRRIDGLQSRAYVTQLVEARGMRLPTGSEIVILPETQPAPRTGRPLSALP